MDKNEKVSVEEEDKDLSGYYDASGHGPHMRAYLGGLSEKSLLCIVVGVLLWAASVLFKDQISEVTQRMCGIVALLLCITSLGLTLKYLKNCMFPIGSNSANEHDDNKDGGQ